MAISRQIVDSCNIIDGWDTDAYLFAITRPAGANGNDPDTAQRYFIGCGSYLRKNGKVVLDSLSKVYTVFTPGEPELEVALQGQPVVRATLRTATKPRRTRLNGQATNAIYDKSTRTVTFFQDSR